MADKTFNDVKINLTLKPQTARANISSSKEDLAVQMGKIQKWYPGLNNYATCETTAGTAIKTVDCPGFELTTGTVVIVKFTYSNTAASPKLNVNSTGAKSIYKYGTTVPGTTVATSWPAGSIVSFTYDGTSWIMNDYHDDTNTDTKVTQTAVGSTYTNYRPLVIGASNSATAGFSPSTVTDTTFTTQAIYCQPASGTIFATKFDGFLAPKLFTSSTVNSTAGSCFFYGNNLLGNANYDWIGIQGDSGSDKFQLMPYAGNMLLYRQNDNGGSSTDWQDWISLLSPSSVTANGGITATITTTTTGTDDGAATFNSGVRLSHTNSVTAVTSNSLLKFKYDAQGHITGSAAVAASDLPSHTHPYLPLAGGTMDNAAVITIPNGSHSSQYTGFGMYHYIGASNAWARGINVNSATDGTRIASLGMYGSADATEPSYAYFGKAYNEAWYELYKNFFRINDDEENGFQFRYKPSSLSSSYIGSFLSLYPGEAYGYGIVVGHSHGGMTVVGGGESAKAICDTFFDSSTTPYPSAFAYDSEELIMSADYGIWFVSGAQNLKTTDHTDWVDLKTALFDNTGNFRPSIDDKGSIGSESFKWASIHGTTIYENGTSLASKYAAIGHTHDSLTSKTLTDTTLNGTAGNFFFKGTNLLGGVNDWVGIQADAGNDKFQLMPNGGGSLMYRQNDTGGTNSSNWSAWNGILTASSVTTDSYLSVAATTTTLGSGDDAYTYNSGVKISHKAYTAKTSGLYKITVDAAGHVSATASVAKGDIPALDYVPNTNAGVNAAINLLSIGNDVPVDADYYISQYTGGGTTHTTYYRRPVSALYSYIANKLQHNAALNMAHLFSGWNTVGWHRVLSLPCSSTDSGRIVRTIELTCIRNYNNGQPEVFSVRLIGLFNATEGFEILYSKSNSASTRYIPKIRMTKSSDGKTLYVDFYYNTTNNNEMTVYCTWLDPNITFRGTYNITWGNGEVVDDSLTVVASLDIPRDITAPGTGFFYVIGTQTASTAAWTGTIPASKLHNGLTIAYYLPYASANSTSVTLNLTLSTGETTGAINVYYTGTSRMTTHYGAGSTIILTYFEAGAISVGGTATTDARWTHSDYNSNTNTYVTQSITTTGNYRALMLGYNDSTTPSNLTTTVTNQVYATANLYAQPSTGSLYMAGNCTIGTSSQSSYPTGGIHVHDVRNLTVTPNSAVERSANFYFHQYTCDGTNNYWWSVLNVRGWSDSYSSWELAGPSSNADQRTTPLYVRTSNTNSAWGNWRKIYDTANPPTYSEVGAAAASHTHGSLNVGNVGNSNTPVYFSSGAPVAVTVPESGAWWSSEPHIDSSGVLEIGRYIDFHATNASTNNYDVRLDASSTNMVTMNSASGSTTFRIAGTLPMLRFQQTTSGKAFDNTSCGIWCRPADTNGVNMFMQSGGCIMIGAGEFASSAYSRKDSTGETQVGYDNIDNSTAERLYLGADGEVQIISNGQNIATYSNNDHHIWKFQTTGQLITPDVITDTLDLQHTMINQSVRSASNCVTLAQWTVDGAASTTYRPGISFHNTGGDSTDKGAIILRPYHHNADPWGKNVGLYIGKGVLKLDGTDVSLSTHTHNYAASATAGGTAKGSESWKFTHGNELNVSKLASSYHHCWIGYRFNTDGTEETGDSTYYINEWRFGDCKGGGLARIYPSAISLQTITIQTGDTSASTYTPVRISLQTLMAWLITTKGYIHSNVNEHVVLTTTFAYADNDILQFTVNGTNMELQLAGVFIEFIGKATSYNSGIFVLKITAAPTNSFTATSGYTKFYANHTAVYHCNGSGYSPSWSVDSSTVAFISSQSSSSSTKYYPIFATGISGPRTLYANNGFYYNTKNGTTTANGLSELVIGNSTASGTAGNRQGNLAIYSLGAYYAQIRPTTLSANRTQELPDAGGEIMVRKRTIRTLNQGENTMLNGQMALYSASTSGGLGYVDAEISGLFTNWSVIMFAITGCGFGTAGSNKFGIHGIVPLDLTKRQHELSITSEPIVACIQYNPGKTDGLGTVVAQYINDNKIRFSFNITGPQSMLYVYGLY